METHLPTLLTKGQRQMKGLFETLMRYRQVLKRYWGAHRQEALTGPSGQNKQCLKPWTRERMDRNPERA
jgi:hypothetical protein